MATRQYIVADALGAFYVNEEKTRQSIIGLQVPVYLNDTTPSGVSGTLATTEGADVTAIAGVLGYSGTLAATEGADVTAITGTIAGISTTGTLAATEAADTTAIAGVLSYTGTLAATEAADTTAIAGSVAGAKIYYFSATGSDANSGLSQALPKQTIAGANALTLNNGDTILFNGGDTFPASGGTYLSIIQSGITISSYGTGQPTLTQTSDFYGVYCEGSDIWVDNLIVTGPGAASSNNQGILNYTYAGSFDSASRFKVTRCTVSGFDKGILVGGETAGSCISPIIGGSSGQGNTVSSCKDGIYVRAVPPGTCTGATVSYNTTHDCTTNGITIGSTVQAGLTGFLVERNVIYANGAASAYQPPTGMLLFGVSSGTVQYNESYGNFAQTGLDGIGIDVECCGSVIVQYNYTHGNAGPGLMRYDYVGGPASSNNTFRWNISLGDCTDGSGGVGSFGSVRFGSAGPVATGDRFYQNTVVAPAAGLKPLLVMENVVASSLLANNIFVGNGLAFKSGAGSFATAINNVEYNVTGTYGTGTITTDPKLVSTATIPTMSGWDPTTLNNYRVGSTSPALNAGVDLTGAPYSLSIGTVDFFGNTLGTQPTNIGAYDGVGVATSTTTGARGLRGTSWARKTLTELRKEAEEQAKADAAKAAEEAAQEAPEADVEANDAQAQIAAQTSVYVDTLDRLLETYTRNHADEGQRLAAYEAELERQRKAYTARQRADEDAILLILMMA